MTAIVDVFTDNGIFGVQNISDVLVLTLNADGLLGFQDEEGDVMVRLARHEIETMFSHYIDKSVIRNDEDRKSRIPPISEHAFNDPNICEVFTHRDRVEMILNGQVVERLCDVAPINYV